MFRLSVIATCLFPAFVFANNVALQDEGLSGFVGIGTAFDQYQTDSLSIDVPAGVKVLAYPSPKFSGEVIHYKEGTYSDIELGSFKVEKDIQTSFSIALNEYRPDSNYCLDVIYNDKNFQNVVAESVCSGEIKEVFTSIPEGYVGGDTLPFSIARNGMTIIFGSLQINGDGSMVLTSRPYASGGVSMYVQSPTLLNVNYYR